MPLLSQMCRDVLYGDGRSYMGTVGLAKALAMLRQELAQAQDEGAGHQFWFEITEAEVEFLVEVDAEGGAKLEGVSG